jgi:hypothetical protein
MEMDQLYSAASDKGWPLVTSGGNYTFGLTPEVTPNRILNGIEPCKEIWASI